MFTQNDVDTNMGGIVAASFVYVSDIKDSFKLPGTHQLYIELNSGKSWNPIYCSVGAELGEDESDEDGGLLYAPYLKVRYPKLSADITHQQRLVTGQKLIVKVETSNGNIIYIGTPANPAQYTFGKMNGGSGASFSGYQGIFKSVQPHSMLFATDFAIQPQA